MHTIFLIIFSILVAISLVPWVDRLEKLEKKLDEWLDNDRRP